MPICWHRPSPRDIPVGLLREVNCVLVMEQDIHKKGFIYREKKKKPTFPLICWGDARALRGSDGGGTDFPYKSPPWASENPS